MALTNLDSWINATKTNVTYLKTASVPTVAGGFGSMLAVAGFPSALSLTIGNTTTGIVPVAGNTGFNVLPAITNTGYLSNFSYCGGAGLLRITDRLFHAGSFPFNASAVTLGSQPSFVGRLPNSSYVGTELWFEAATAFTGIPTVTVTYTNQDGVTGRTTGAFSLGIAPILARCFRIPLASGDTGIQTIESVTCITATAGTFNLIILRQLCSLSSSVAYSSQVADLTITGIPKIYPTSAIFPLFQTATTATGTPLIDMVICDA